MHGFSRICVLLGSVIVSAGAQSEPKPANGTLLTNVRAVLAEEYYQKAKKIYERREELVAIDETIQPLLSKVREHDPNHAESKKLWTATVDWMFRRVYFEGGDSMLPRPLNMNSKKEYIVRKALRAAERALAQGNQKWATSNFKRVLLYEPTHQRASEALERLTVSGEEK